MKNALYHLIPKNYTITFEPDLETFTFSGKELLTFDLPDSTEKVLLDSIDLNIISCVLLQKDARIICQKKLSGNTLVIDL